MGLGQEEASSVEISHWPVTSVWGRMTFMLDACGPLCEQGVT